jgi:hypothetical protein
VKVGKQLSRVGEVESNRQDHRMESGTQLIKAYSVITPYLNQVDQ